jgi:hypothetical protein
MVSAAPRAYGQSQPFPTRSWPSHAGPLAIPVDRPPKSPDISGMSRMEEDRRLRSSEDSVTRVVKPADVSYWQTRLPDNGLGLMGMDGKCVELHLESAIS